MQTGAVLPTFLIINSPMKNISERENRGQFEGLHALVYSLVEGELRGTQVVLIDKEYLAPPDGFNLKLVERHMSPEEPLLRGFKPQPPVDPSEKREGSGGAAAAPI